MILTPTIWRTAAKYSNGSADERPEPTAHRALSLGVAQDQPAVEAVVGVRSTWQV
jgi:hypothetical protein